MIPCEQSADFSYVDMDLATLGKPLIIIYKNTTTAKPIRLDNNTHQPQHHH